MQKLMSRQRRASRSLLAAAVALTTGLAAESLRADVVFDNITPAVTTGSGALLFYTTQASAEYIGRGVTPTGGSTSITGLDVIGVNETGMALSGVHINVYIWGTVNTGTVNASNPAFGNLLGSYTFSDIEPIANGDTLDYEDGNNAGTTAGIPLPSSLNISGGSPVGITINFQGTTDGSTFSDIPGLSTLFTVGPAPSVGTNPYNGFYVNSGGTDTNGNFTTSRVGFTNTTSGSAYANQAPLIRLYGDIPGAGGPKAWSNAVSGSWTNASSWTPTGVPNSTSDVTFNLSASTPYTATIVSPQVVKDLYVQNDNVTIDLNGSSAVLTIGSDLVVGQMGSTATTGVLSLTHSIGAATAHVNVGGQVKVGSGGGVGTLTVGSKTILGLPTTGFVMVGPGSSLVVQSTAQILADAVLLAGTSDAWTGKLDITGGALDLGSDTVDLPTVLNQVKQGFNLAGGGRWNGVGGITSSTAAADSRHITAVGVIRNDQSGTALYGNGMVAPLFDGYSPAFTDVLLKYTYFGDANLDGKVDGSDYTLIDAGFLAGSSGWYNGDFNYDGTVDASDYTLIDNAYNQQNAGSGVSPSLVGVTPALTNAGGSDIARLGKFQGNTALIMDGSDLQASPTALYATPAAVPEPAGLTTTVIVTAAGLRRRRR